MKQKLDKRLLLSYNDDFKRDVSALEAHYSVRGMSATIRKAVTDAARAVQKAVK